MSCTRALVFRVLMGLLVVWMFGDVGRSCRYTVKVVPKEGPALSGYIYHGTYGPFYQSEKEPFATFFFRELNLPQVSVHIYQEIKTVDVGGHSCLDFSSPGYEQLLNLSDIADIELIEELTYPVGDRLILLSQPEYDLVAGNPKEQCFIYNEKLAENCVYRLMAWKPVENMQEIKVDIAKQMDQLLGKEEEASEASFRAVTAYVLAKRKDLLDQGILMVQACGPL